MHPHKDVSEKCYNGYFFKFKKKGLLLQKYNGDLMTTIRERLLSNKHCTPFCFCFTIPTCTLKIPELMMKFSFYLDSNWNKEIEGQGSLFICKHLSQECPHRGVYVSLWWGGDTFFCWLITPV